MKFLFITLLLLFNNPLKHVHEPYRLALLEYNKTVIGKVKYIEESIDGDIHIRLMVSDKTILIKNNFEQEDSCLVLEIVCGCKSIFKICKNYVNEIQTPKINDSIMVSGPFVFDKRHKINEIHPVLEIHKLN